MHHEVSKLKKAAGRDILVYGGATFAASLIQNELVDEFYFLLNPFRLGNGSTLFQPNDDVQVFTLIQSMPFPCGTVLLQYTPNQSRTEGSSKNRSLVTGNLTDEMVSLKN